MSSQEASAPAHAHAPAPATQPSTGASTPTTTPPGSSKVEAQLADAERLKDEGNALYAKGDVKAALQKWHYALLHSSGINSFSTQYGSRSSSSQNARAQALTAALHSNLCASYLASAQHDKVLASAGKVLALCGCPPAPGGSGSGSGHAGEHTDAQHAQHPGARNQPLVVKALYRRGKALLALGQVQKAAGDIDAAMDLAPGDAGVRALAREVVQIEEAKLEKQRKEMGGFLKGKELGPGEGSGSNGSEGS